MRDWGHVPDTSNIQSGTLEGTNGCLTPAAGSLDINIHLTQALGHTFTCCVLRSQLGGVRGTLPRAFESGSTRAPPGDNIPLGVCQCYQSIVEGRLDICPSCRHNPAFSPPCPGTFLCWHPVLLSRLSGFTSWWHRVSYLCQPRSSAHHGECGHWCESVVPGPVDYSDADDLGNCQSPLSA
jgi:hypothetical protein